MIARALLTVLFFGTIVGARAEASPPATEPSSRLERARVCWAALDPECAEAELATLREHLEPLAPAARVEVWRLSAEIALAAERHDQGRRYLLALLDLDPRFAPAAWPEPWNQALAEARSAAPDRLPPELSPTLPSEATARASIAIEVRALDPGGIARCELIVRDLDEAGERLRVALLAADGIVFRGEIPAELVRAPGVGVRVEAVDRAGNLACWPAAERCADAAHTIPVAPPPALKPSPITSRWWFWTAIGVAVVGGGVALALALDDGGGAGEGGRVGDLVVREEFP